MNKGGSFRLYDKKTQKTYCDAGILVCSDNKWYTSGWLTRTENNMADDIVSISGSMWRVPHRTLTPFRGILLRIFQMTFGRLGFISLWVKERLRDILITKTKSSTMKYKRELIFNPSSDDLLTVRDYVFAEKNSISLIYVNTKNTTIYVPSSRYYVGIEENPFKKFFSPLVSKAEIDWKIREDSKMEFMVR